MHLTDPSRNARFEDSCFNSIPLAMSKATILCTFNNVNRLDAALQDRMGRIIFTGALSYKQKICIARGFLLPEAVDRSQVVLPPDSVTYPLLRTPSGEVHLHHVYIVSLLHRSIYTRVLPFDRNPQTSSSHQ